MDCREFDRRLDALLDGTCSPDGWREADEHQRSCARCGELFEAMSGSGEALDDTAGAELTDDILARTSGLGCESAHERLCDYVDGLLAPVDRELVRQHLSHCTSCAALSAAVERATAVLPSLAELPVPAGFALSVMRATSRKPAAAPAPSRVMAWLTRLAARPRFSLEFAYACTLILVVLVGNPVDAFRDAKSAASPYVRPRIEAVAGRVTEPLTVRAREWRASTSSLAASVRHEAAAKQSSIEKLAGWLDARVAAPLRAWFDAGWNWTQAAYEALGRALSAVFSGERDVATEPVPRPVR
jgi:anti-sigma factor RsiW